MRLKSDRLIETYWNNLEKSLRTIYESKVSYKIIVAHHPIYSIGSHGSSQCLIEKLLPLLFRYKIQLYLSGHDHNLQHLTGSNLESNVDMMISGSGGKVQNLSKKNSKKVPNNCSKFFGFKSGFLLFKASEKFMTTSFIDSDGEYLYEKSIFKNE